MGTHMNTRFQNAIQRKPNDIPPIWMMRQAGRYHSHYQKIRKSHSFEQVCKNPKVAAEAALGPIQDFDFDLAILFSDILFPLMALHLPIKFEEFGGPKLISPMTKEHLGKVPRLETALAELEFQKEAMLETRKILPSTKSLIGFVGGPFTLFTFATQGTHKNGIRDAKMAFPELWPHFAEILLPLLTENIRLQFEGGAEVVMILDTAAGELATESLLPAVVEPLRKLAQTFPHRLGYYSKGMDQSSFLKIADRIPELSGFGVDQRVDLRQTLSRTKGFVQGHFDPEWMSLETNQFEKCLVNWWKHLGFTHKSDLTGWVAGLGHGLTPHAREDNVRLFVDRVREFSAELL